MSDTLFSQVLLVEREEWERSRVEDVRFSNSSSFFSASRSKKQSKEKSSTTLTSMPSSTVRLSYLSLSFFLSLPSLTSFPPLLPSLPPPGDPQTYHGKIRCSTGLSLLRMTSFIQSHEGAVVVASLAIPVRVVHGDADRVCSASNSVEFVKKMSHVGEGKRKRECEIWEGYEHVMFGYGWDETDDRHREMVSPGFNLPFPSLLRSTLTYEPLYLNLSFQRLRVLKDLHDWMVEQSSSG